MDPVWVWIPLSIFAALMQAVRTAAQKTLNQSMSTMGTTYVRSLFGMPALLVFLGVVTWYTGIPAPSFNPMFVLHAFLGGLTQVVATALLISLFQLRNFAVGTMLTKTDLIMTAVIGTLLFAEHISALGWLAIGVVMCGVVLMLLGRSRTSILSAANESWRALVFGRAMQVALACALMFSFSYLFLRAATLELGVDRHYLWRAGWTLIVVTLMQTIGLGIWLAVKEPAVFRQMWPMRRIASFIGLTSALGSVGWYSAFALQNAAYVRAVGQIEAVFTLAISWLYFREKITTLELTGIAITVAGVLMFRLV
jgi:drug/metabolite transporter (DMT)-like permease